MRRASPSWPSSSRLYSIAGGKIVHARVQRIDQPAGAEPLERELSGRLVFGVPRVGGADYDRAL